MINDEKCRAAFEAANGEHEKELKHVENRITELKTKQQQVEHELSECKVKLIASCFGSMCLFMM